MQLGGFLTERRNLSRLGVQCAAHTQLLCVQCRDPGYCMPVKLPQGQAPATSKELSPALWEKQRVKKEDAGATKTD
eukprot:COSAG02_NODE_6604_length_3466_cov_3.836650_4_plen_76_part_00